MIRTRSSCNRGVSIVEALLSAFLVLVIMVASGDIIRDLGDSLRRSDGQDATLEAGLVALTRMGQEATEQAVLTRPSGLAPDSELVFTRLDPILAGLPEPIPTPAPASWSPPTLVVRYYVNANQRLVREVSDATAVETQEVAESVAGLALTNQPDGTLLIELSVFDGHRVRSLSSRVFLPTRGLP